MYILQVSSRAFQRVFTCRRRYSRERASQSLEVIQFIHAFASLSITQCVVWSQNESKNDPRFRAQQRCGWTDQRKKSEKYNDSVTRVELDGIYLSVHSKLWDSFTSHDKYLLVLNQWNQSSIRNTAPNCPLPLQIRGDIMSLARTCRAKLQVKLTPSPLCLFSSYFRLRFFHAREKTVGRFRLHIDSYSLKINQWTPQSAVRELGLFREISSSWLKTSPRRRIRW